MALIYCSQCGHQVSDKALSCPNCGEPITNILSNREVVVEVPEKRNGAGKTGLTFAILSLTIGWIPFFGWLAIPLAFIFSLIGVFRSPRGQAIAGLIITPIAVLVTLFISAIIFNS